MPATVADLLTVMGVMNNELDTSSGGLDETRSINALTIAQHYFETVAAALPDCLGNSTTVTTTASTETTAWPAALLRLDAVWFLDDTNSKPVYKLKRITEIGGHTPSLPWPLQVTLATGTGGPRGYFTNMTNFYWMPLPDATHTLRVYGLLQQAEFAARTEAYTYPTRCKNAIANFAVKVMSIGIGDDKGDLDELASSIFMPLLRGLRKFDRSEPMPRGYNYEHTT